MSIEKFFGDVLPREGESCFVVMYHDVDENGEERRKSVHKWRDVANSTNRSKLIFHTTQSNADLYFALATYSAQSRKQEHVQHLQSFWLDIDAGAAKVKKHGDKVYASAKDAMEGLHVWLQDYEIPLPTYVVLSGAGLHVYWCLDAPVDMRTWYSVADALRRVCVDGGLRIDPGITIDPARILRVPGALHTGTGNTVKIQYAGERVTFADFSAAITAHAPLGEYQSGPAAAQLGLGPRPAHIHAATKIWEGIAESVIKDFSRCLGEYGCQQLKFCMDNQSDVDEPLWRAALSIVNACKDSEMWAHRISEQHPRYSKVETLAKLHATLDMPQTCAQFDIVRPKGCEGCPHRGNIKSPVRIAVMPITSEGPVQVHVKLESTETPLSTVVVSDDVEVIADLVDVMTVIPEYPLPFKRGTDGGIWVETEGVMECVYEHDTYIVARAYSPEEGEYMLVRFHSPNDGMRTFSMPMGILTSDAKCLELLATHGVMPRNRKSRAGIMSFLSASAHRLVNDTAAQPRHESFGWTAGEESFILGDIEFFADNKARPLLPTPRLAPWANVMVPAKNANIKAWAELVGMYNRKGFEASQFVLGTALSTPLYTLFNMTGGILHMFSKDSGFGKTSIAYVGLSMWGKPLPVGDTRGLAGIEKDTANATFTKASTLRSLPVYIDEITLREQREATDLVYTFTQGREKDRGEASSNTLRKNVAQWQTCAITSGNKSLYDLLSGNDQSDAMFARIIEIPYDSSQSLSGYYDPLEVSDRIAAMTTTHSAVVGQYFIRHVLNHKEQVRAQLRECYERLFKVLNFTSKERYWASMLACTITALEIGKRLGFWEFDVQAVTTWIVAHIGTIRHQAKAQRVSAGELMGRYINDNLDAQVVVNKPADGGDLYAQKSPSREVAIRTEDHTGNIYISTAHLADWCHEAGFSYSELEQSLIAAGGELGPCNLLGGTMFKSSCAVNTICITQTILGVLNNE